MKQNKIHIKHPVYRVSPPGVVALCGDFGLLQVAKDFPQVSCLRCKAKYEWGRKKALKKEVKKRYGSLAQAKKEARQRKREGI